VSTITTGAPASTSEMILRLGQVPSGSMKAASVLGSGPAVLLRRGCLLLRSIPRPDSRGDPLGICCRGFVGETLIVIAIVPVSDGLQRLYMQVLRDCHLSMLQTTAFANRPGGLDNRCACGIAAQTGQDSRNSAGKAIYMRREGVSLKRRAMLVKGEVGAVDVLPVAATSTLGG